jgi:catechol 2,3-dioxygenase-like lactoylglutathione lyase family enzyme
MTAITHVGLSVADLDRAVAWYTTVLGLERLGPPSRVSASDGHAGAVAADVLGQDVGSFRQAHLTGSNGVALELFQFEQQVARWRGIFHVCFVPPSFDRAVARIASDGGRRSSRVWRVFPDAPYRMCYCQDPFGNTVELYSHSHERTYANR